MMGMVASDWNGVTAMSSFIWVCQRRSIRCAAFLALSSPTPSKHAIASDASVAFTVSFYSFIDFFVQYASQFTQITKFTSPVTLFNTFNNKLGYIYFTCVL